MIGYERVNNSQGKNSPTETSSSNTAGPEYSNINEKQGNDHNTNYMKMIEVLKE